LEILEYCDIKNFLPPAQEREQYYMDKLNPRYNTLKIAGSSSGHKLSAPLPSAPLEPASWRGAREAKETKAKISSGRHPWWLELGLRPSEALKGTYVKEKSP
jgi:hypothetical protein